ncbi:hypothetical protein BDZ45DRAFT_233535 [Acephala macrosclerotiorum]|nr:hypothetical protein BDZ45DRAFT_233535 [Acephala macrosclerotiorum]
MKSGPPVLCAAWRVSKVLSSLPDEGSLITTTAPNPGFGTAQTRSQKRSFHSDQRVRRGPSLQDTIRMATSHKASTHTNNPLQPKVFRHLCHFNKRYASSYST